MMFGRLTIEIQVLTQVSSCASWLYQNNQQRTEFTFWTKGRKLHVEMSFCNMCIEKQEK